ncbi:MULTISPECIES: HAD-IA family hydrolase [Acinetobacter]|uniref:HAD-IA family hydrolase n=1 Tax=Acinetobacter TaxID=469 RepID=UPI0001BBAD2E|nr:MULTISPECIES: HAD-IA family hydrolase [Acinetobacter]EBL5619716.1 HAD-IA family hydrolase [Salmonella enterica subsp. enterica serovar Agona]ECC3298641.1 HAD family hydrolase [Salmonella enterica subsp. enterica]AUC07040.1 HAD-IA family hydrolase [Acinetobacter lwoffii]ECF7044695.1 HAD family hydrolase [Salmonella enterica subsp. enterica]EEY88727.1 HAD hydrolase, family IA, variant 1 [Acinetobacter lwoffii SH145]
MIKNILIDLDGTLTDPKVGITTSARYGLEKIGHPISDEINIDWIIGPPLKASLAKILNVEADHVLAEQALMGYRERFAVKGLYENHVFEGVAETLAELKRRGYRLFVATAKPTVYAKQILEHFDLAQYFTDIHGSELNGDRTNKAELIQYILAQQKLQADQCMMVGDREHDIFGARQNGIDTIAVNYGYGSQEELALAQPKYQIDRFNQLLDYFK